MSHNHTSTNPFNPTLHLLADAASEAAYHEIEQQSNPPNPSDSPNPAQATPDTTTDDLLLSSFSGPLSPTGLTPHQIAVKRTKEAKARLAMAHEGWTLVVQALLKRGLVPADQELTREMKEFGDAICGRYAAASFLWRVLGDTPPGDWFGPRKKFDATLRRLRTLKGLEGSLLCWEEIVLRLLKVVDNGEEEGSEQGGGEGVVEDMVVEEVKRVLGRWRRGVPSRP